MKLRPNLGHVYIALHDMETYGEVLGELGFDPLHSVTMDFDGDLLRSAVMRFGPGSVDGWLARLVAKELGIDPQNLLDESSRELVIEGQRTPLTPLEFAVVSYLSSRRGAAVSHVDLIENVWGYRYSGESNVDAVVVRGLRAKLGEHAKLIETVRGVGYRLRS